MGDVLSSHAWRKLSAQVIKEEPTCRIQLDGCTGVSETADHIIPRSIRPDLALVRTNVQGACRWCNEHRGNRDLNSVVAQPALEFFNTTPIAIN